MTTIGLFQPIIPTLTPKSVVTSSKKMTTLDKAVAWFNSPAGFEKATKTFAAAATLAVVAGIVYYLNQNNFFGSSGQPNPAPQNGGTDTSYNENCDIFGMCVTDQTCQPNPPGYGDTQNWETCSKFASESKSEPSSEKTTTTNKPQSNTKETDSSDSTNTNYPFIQPTCPVESVGKSSNLTLPHQPFNFTGNTIVDPTSPPLNLSKIVASLVAHNNKSNITASMSTDSVAGETILAPLSQSISNNSGNQSNSTKETIHVLPQSISEPFTQAKEVFESSKFCQNTNSTQVAALCNGILNGQVVFTDINDLSAFPNLRSAFTHIYQSANGALRDILCFATEKFWEIDNVIHLGSPTSTDSLPVSLLLNKDQTKGGPADFADIHQTHKNTCNSKN